MVENAKQKYEYKRRNVGKFKGEEYQLNKPW